MYPCNLLDSFLDKTLDVRRSSDFERHLIECVACRLDIENWQQVRIQLESRAALQRGRTATRSAASRVATGRLDCRARGVLAAISGEGLCDADQAGMDTHMLETTSIASVERILCRVGRGMSESTKRAAPMRLGGVPRV